MRRSKMHFPFAGQDVLAVLASGGNALNSASAQLSTVSSEIQFYEQSAKMYRALGITARTATHLRELKALHKKMYARVTRLRRVTDEFHKRIASKVCRSCNGQGKQFQRLAPYPNGVNLVTCADCNGTGMRW